MKQVQNRVQEVSPEPLSHGGMLSPNICVRVGFLVSPYESMV